MVFPSSPTDGQRYIDTINKYLYEYSSSTNTWRNISTTGVLSTTGYVPTMSSNSQSGFTISGSSQYNTTTYAYFRAFDGSESTSWATLGQTSGAYIEMTFPEEQVVWQVTLSPRNGGNTEWFYQWAIQYYDNTLTEWIDWKHVRLDLNNDTNINFSRADFTIPASQWRIYADAANGVNPGMRTIQFFVKT